MLIAQALNTPKAAGARLRRMLAMGDQEYMAPPRRIPKPMPKLAEREKRHDD